MTLWDQVRSNMTEWYAIAADKTGEMARVGVRKYDQFALAREMERSFQDLGRHVVALIRAGAPEIAADERVLALCERIRILEDQLAQKEREIQAIRAAGATAAGRAAAGAGVSGGVSPADAGGPGTGSTSAAGQLPIAAGAADGLDPDEEEELEAAIAPGGPGRMAAEEPWDEEIALWHEPLDLDEDGVAPGRGEGLDGTGTNR